MPRHRKPAPRKHRNITVRPVYRDKPDTEALVKALIHSVLTRGKPDS
jgi:hypothetical protein